MALAVLATLVLPVRASADVVPAQLGRPLPNTTLTQCEQYKESPLDTAPSGTPASLPTTHLTTRGNQVWDAEHEVPFQLRSVNWYGAEEQNMIVDGLQLQTLSGIVAEIKKAGFNSVRIPFSNEMVELSELGYDVCSSAVAAEPLLMGLTPIQALKVTIEEITSQGLLVILDDHTTTASWCCSAKDENGLWYNGAFTTAQWEHDWLTVVKEFGAIPGVVGVDLRNEPREDNTGHSPRWNSTPGEENWREAATRAGGEILHTDAAVLHSAPNLLVFVEGLGGAAGDLTGAMRETITLTDPVTHKDYTSQVVYEAHDYSFYHGNAKNHETAEKIEQDLENKWGKLLGQGYAVWIGEFGTCNTSNRCLNEEDWTTGNYANPSQAEEAYNGYWFTTFLHYAREHPELSLSYWPLNGVSSPSQPNKAGQNGKTWGGSESYGVLNTKYDGFANGALESALRTPFEPEDVFIGVDGGQIQQRLPDGTLTDTLETGISSFTTGMAFDRQGNLYVTDFGAANVSRFNQGGELLGTFGLDFSSLPESIVFDKEGDAYVGSADGNVLKFDANGSFLQEFPTGRSDWIDLASDQCTLYYTDEGERGGILRYNVCTNEPLSEFVPRSALEHPYALRLLPSGGLLVADSSLIRRFDQSGKQIQTYSYPGNSNWFALNLDPDGTSFYSADFGTSNVVKFDIASGEPLAHYNTGTPSGTVFGIVVDGELTLGSGSEIFGTVKDPGGRAVGGALIQACPHAGGSCFEATSDADGGYSLSGLRPGEYDLEAFPPAGSNLAQDGLGPVTLEPGQTQPEDFVLPQPGPPPNNVSISPTRGTITGIPIVDFGKPFSLTISGCTGGTASYEVAPFLSFLTGTSKGDLPESPGGSGNYATSITPPGIWYGPADVTIDLVCPGGKHDNVSFTLYIDPTGHVVTTEGIPVSGATVTLYRGEGPLGPFTEVPNGSPVMSPMNRNNPDITQSDGSFGWDVIGGYYKIRASKVGCTAPGNPSQAYVESPVEQIPPAVDNLVLTLQCQVVATTLTLAPKAGTDRVGTAHTVTAKAKDASGNPAVGVSVVFNVTGANNAHGTMMTDSDGDARFTFTGTHTGFDSISAFADNNANGMQDTGEPSDTASELWYGLLSAGSFVIGDKDAAVGTSVTLWGAQWWKLNSLSGGSAPAGFKGFENNPATAVCGKSWTTDPGNSTPPPVGPLPEYLAVIVSSKVNKAGPTISGNTLHEVVVKTNPGYAANPDHAGTDRVVAQIC